MTGDEFSAIVYFLILIYLAGVLENSAFET